MITPQDSLIKVLQDSVESLNLSVRELNSNFSFWKWLSSLDTNIVIVIVSLITILITTAANYYINIYSIRKNYVYEYQKKIINKKFDAYEIFLNFLPIFRRFKLVQGKKIQYEIFVDNTTLLKFMNDFVTIMTHSVWIDMSISQKLNELSTFIFEKFNDKSDIEVYNLGFEHSDKISVLATEIELLIQKEIFQLYEKPNSEII